MTSNKESKYSDVPIRVKSWGYIIVVFTLMLITPLSMNIIVTLLSIYAMFEYFRMIKLENKALRYLNYLISFTMFFILNKNDYNLFVLVNMGYLLLIFLLKPILLDKKESIVTVALAVFICLFCLEHLSYIRSLEIPNLSYSGIKITIFVVVVTELNDVFQYLTGKSFGKKKIASKISPNKTLEGFIGGVFLSMVLSSIMAIFLLPQQSILIDIAIGAMIAIFGFLGDLLMSYIKRKSNVKDTGNLIPGHGGLLDRLDSLIFVLPLFYWFCIKLYV